MGKSPTLPIRYKRTVERLTTEACWLFIEQTALVALGTVDAHGLDFFRVAFTGLLGDRLLRLVRILEQDTQVASFWYLHRCNANGVQRAVDRAGISLADLRDFSDRLKVIRDKTFVHIDKAGVFDPKMIYTNAGIKNSKVDKVIRGLWLVMQHLYQTTTGHAYPHDVYSAGEQSHPFDGTRHYARDDAAYTEVHASDASERIRGTLCARVLESQDGRGGR